MSRICACAEIGAGRRYEGRADHPVAQAPTRPHLGRGMVSVLLALAGALGPGPLDGHGADAPGIQEYQLKAAFLSKLPMFIQWPKEAGADSTQPIRIGVLGQSPFGPHLEIAARGKSVSGRKLTVELCPTVKEAAECQVVFLAAPELAQPVAIPEGLRGRPILLVSDAPGFVQAGGMVGLVAAERRVRLEIGRDALQRVGLRVDPHLLRLADVVDGPPPTPKEAR